MKKLIVVAAILAVGGTAFAASLNVPWFLDRGAADATWPPTTLEKTFITVKNTTGSDIVVTIAYTSADGTSNDGWTETDGEHVPPGGQHGYRVPPGRQRSRT